MVNKLKLRLSAQKDNYTLYTNWQIAKLSNDFSEFYYKTILLKDLSEYLSQGVQLNEVIIFNSSININSQYTKYKNPILNLNSSNDVLKYYHLGSPVPLFPNRQILVIHEFFEAYRQYYSIVNRHKLFIGSKKEDLSKLYEISKKESITEFNIVDFFISSITESNIDNDNRKKCIKEIDGAFKNFNREFQKSLENHLEYKSEQFNYIFNRFERPIIGVKLADDEIKLLGSDFFVQSEFTYSNSRFLETNLIKQNSPLEMTLTMSLLILPSILIILREKWILMIAQNKNGELDQEILNLEKEIKKMEAKSQQEGLSINSPSQLPDSLLNSVNKKGRQVFDELDVEVI
ncbi:TPA: hypothetical protein ACT2IM_002070 [Streptococcus suis]|nr:hypothetical protein [Streptococcus suis]